MGHVPHEGSVTGAHGHVLLFNTSSVPYLLSTFGLGFITFGVTIHLAPKFGQICKNSHIIDLLKNNFVT